MSEVTTPARIEDPFDFTADGVEPRPLSAARVAAPQSESTHLMIEIMRLAADHPRNLKVVSQNISMMAQRLGEAARYRWEVKNRKKGTVDVIEGPTIKCAMMVARTMGNCVVGAKVVQEDHEGWTFEGRFVDFETRTIVLREFHQRKAQSTGMADGARAADIVFQIGQSKAMRNAIVAACGPWIDFAMEEAQRSAIEWVMKDPGKAKQVLRDRATALGIDTRWIEVKRGRKIENMTAQDIALCVAEIRAIQEGQATAEDVYGDKDVLDSQAVAQAEERAEVKAAAEAKADGRTKEAREAKKRAAATIEEAKPQEVVEEPTPSPTELAEAKNEPAAPLAAREAPPELFGADE